MIGEIYIIKNTINQKIYIGKTIVGYINRFNKHKHSSKNCNQAIYRAMRKYGVNNFYVELLKSFEDCSHELLNTWEIIMIKKYKSNLPKFGYNMTTGGDGNQMTDEIIDKIKTTNRLPENRIKMSKAIKNKYAENPEYLSIVISHLPKAREAGLLRDHKHSEEVKDKIRNSCLNSEKAKEGRKTMKEKVTQHHRTPEFREKCRQRMLNKIKNGEFSPPNIRKNE